MGLFDQFQFDPQSYEGGGLLAQLRAGLLQHADQLQNNQPSPLDSAQWPAGPLNGPDSPTSYANIGSYKMPIFGQAPQQEQEDAIPVNARPAQLMPQQQAQQSVAPSQPNQTSMPTFLSNGGGSFLDRLNTGLQSIGNGGSLIGALTGNRTDPVGQQQQNLKAQFAAISQTLQDGGLSKQQADSKAMLAVLNPEAGKTILGEALTNKEKFGFTTLPDGTIVRQNPRTGEVAPAYQSQPKADWGVISKNDGVETYGWIDKNKRTVIPVGPAEPQKETITGPDGKQIPIPPGVDRKTFINEVSRAGAKAAAGEKTEVQAKSEKFGNKMELAEKNLQGIENVGTEYTGRSLEAGGVYTNWLQSEKYQKYKQARDNFITALLRDESGAAIGTQEFNRYEKELFPQPGDNPGVIAQKAEARKIAIEAMKKSAGPGYKSPELPSSSNAAPTQIDDLLKKYGDKNG